MFAKDEYVFHESGGVCRIADIQVAPLDNMPADRSYYIVQPLHDPNSVIYVPVDSDRIFLRRLLTKAEAQELLSQIPQIAVIEAENAKALRGKYIDAMHTHSPIEWVRVIKTIYQRAQAARAQRLSETERSFSESAKRHLHTELSLALELPLQEIEQYITTYVQQLA